MYCLLINPQLPITAFLLTQVCILFRFPFLLLASNKTNIATKTGQKHHYPSNSHARQKQLMTSSFYATLTSGGSGQGWISKWNQQNDVTTEPLLTSQATGVERYSTGSDDVSVWAVTSPRYQFRKSNSMKLALRELDEGKRTKQNMRGFLNIYYIRLISKRDNSYDE